MTEKLISVISFIIRRLWKSLAPPASVFKSHYAIPAVIVVFRLRSFRIVNKTAVVESNDRIVEIHTLAENINPVFLWNIVTNQIVREQAEHGFVVSNRSGIGIVDMVVVSFHQIADEHAGPETTNTITFSKIPCMTPDADNGLCSDQILIATVNQIAVIVSKIRVNQTFRSSVTAHHEHFSFLSNSFVDHTTSVSRELTDFNDLDIRHSVPEISQNRSVSVTHVRKNDCCHNLISC